MTTDIINTTWDDKENKTSLGNLFPGFILSAIWRDIMNAIWDDNASGQHFPWVHFDGNRFLSFCYNIYIYFLVRLIVLYPNYWSMTYLPLPLYLVLVVYHIFQNTVQSTYNEVVYSEKSVKSNITFFEYIYMVWLYWSLQDLLKRCFVPNLSLHVD